MASLASRMPLRLPPRCHSLLRLPPTRHNCHRVPPPPLSLSLSSSSSAHSHIQSNAHARAVATTLLRSGSQCSSIRVPSEGSVHSCSRAAAATLAFAVTRRHCHTSHPAPAPNRGRGSSGGGRSSSKRGFSLLAAVVTVAGAGLLWEHCLGCGLSPAHALARTRERTKASLGGLVAGADAEGFDSTSSNGVRALAKPAEDGSDSRPSITSYTVTRMAGDGSCLFHAVAHGACAVAGRTTPLPAEELRAMAHTLRQQAADELVKRRDQTEWFIEGNFDAYVRAMRQPHVWGGEPELLMLSHVLRHPITVYIPDERNRSQRAITPIAEYGQEYASLLLTSAPTSPDQTFSGGDGVKRPIGVLYNGRNHYDAVQIAYNDANVLCDADAAQDVDRQQDPSRLPSRL